MSIFADWQPEYERAGITTFPVNLATKKPAVRGYIKAGPKASQKWAVSFDQADGFGFACGERNNLTVLDIDTDDTSVLRQCRRDFGETPIIARSASGGFHLWYRFSGEARKIRMRESVDLLGGGYCIAPPSATEDRRYQFLQGSLDDIDALPKIRLPDEFVTPGIPTPANSNTRLVEQGKRNDHLFRACLSAARSARSFDELLSRAMELNATELAMPLPDSEVVTVAKSAWRYEEQGRNFSGGKQDDVEAQQIDALSSEPNGGDAFLLLRLLRRKHLGLRDTFWVANAFADTFGWTLARFRKARTLLIEKRLIVLVEPEHGKSPAVYRFRSMESQR